MIYIRAFFKWQIATVEHAFEFCNNFLINGMSNVPKEERIDRLNKCHLKGITYQDLIKVVDYENK